MSTLILVVLGIYALVFVGFLVAIYREAPKHGTKVRLPHYLVALGWPLWGLWYLWVLASDYFERRKKNRSK